MKDVYICSAREDRAFTAWLTEALEKRGFSCFKVPADLDPTRGYRQQITEAIASCLGFVVLSSAASRGDASVLDEVEHALAIGREVLSFEVDPVPIEPFGCLLFGKNTHRYAAYRDREQAAEELAAHLRVQKEKRG